MRHRYLFLLALAAALAGCSAGEETTGLSSTASDRQAAAASVPGVAASAAVGPGSSIASMPDRGELMRYPAPRPTSGSNAPALVPVAISEEHAFAAIHRKQLVLEAPDGVRSRVAYARHQDHGDGNWTWIGRDEAGRSALLTFGQNAVFGSIQRADGSELRIVTQNRRTFAVVVRPNQLRGVETSSGSDALNIPDVISQASARTADAGQSDPVAVGTAAATAAAANEIDVFLGYSSGLAQRIGSPSGAETRMQNLVAISNEGYQNSGVTYRIRLVGTLQVNYGDNTRNDSALHALTGSTGNGSSPIDPAFNALRAAREQSGADLVSFVRQFREPEQDGCGIAWLLGGGQTNIDQSDAPFAYSVVSDGSDVRESDGRTYFCRDETLAHELGHNMGQAHNQEDSTSAGRHAYSYGFREASTTGFYTIMAYRIAESSQFSIRHFANPNVLFSGRATGVANQSDNARSMNETMPLIALFRASITPPATPAHVRADMNGDGRSDIVWRNPVTQQTSRWYMNGPSVIGGQSDSQSSGWTIVGIGDFDADGRDDLLWSSGSALVMWRPNASNQYVGSFVGNIPAGGWSIAGVGDMNGDGRSDIVWRNVSAQQTSRWFMDGPIVIGGQSDNQAAAWQIVGIGDFDGDGRDDLLWASSSSLVMWRPNASNQYVGSFVGSIPAEGWSVAAIGDVNGDGRADIVWRNASTEQTSRWYMNGPTVIGGQADFQSAAWRIVGIGDYDGDGRSDLLWANSTTLIMWRPNQNLQYVGSVVSTLPGGDWSIANGVW